MKSCEMLERVLKVSEGDREKTGRVVARILYRILRDHQFSHPAIIDLAGKVLDEVIRDIKANGKDQEEAVEIGFNERPPGSREVA